MKRRRSFRLAFREHDFHRHGAADRRLARIENRAHAALRDHRADIVFFPAEKLIRQQFRERRGRRGIFALIRNLEREHAELRADAGREQGEFGDGRAVDKGAVAGAEILEKKPALLRLPTAHVCARRDRP